MGPPGTLQDDCSEVPAAIFSDALPLHTMEKGNAADTHRDDSSRLHHTSHAYHNPTAQHKTKRQEFQFVATTKCCTTWTQSQHAHTHGGWHLQHTRQPHLMTLLLNQPCQSQPLHALLRSLGPHLSFQSTPTGLQLLLPLEQGGLLLCSVRPPLCPQRHSLRTHVVHPAPSQEPARYGLQQHGVLQRAPVHTALEQCGAQRGCGGGQLTSSSCRSRSDGPGRGCGRSRRCRRQAPVRS